jgi:pimeloyl-ACP methyl ester carboxylesterase
MFNWKKMIIISACAVCMRGEAMNPVHFDEYRSRLTLVKSSPGKEYNWLFLPGGPGADSQYYTEFVDMLDLPGKVWFVDLPENGSNKLGDCYDEQYDFASWEPALKHVLKSFDHVILVGQSFSGIYPLLFPEIEQDLEGLVILCSASRPWIENAMNMAKEKNLPSFEKEMQEFLSNKTAETFRKAREVFVHYYFTRETLQRGTEILFRGDFNFHAMNWWLSKAPSIDFDQILIPNIPTLIVGGSEDYAVPFKGYLTDERFQKPNIILREIPGASHVPWLEKPQEVKGLFERFIAVFL